MYWYNYDTNEYDYIDTPEDYATCVPEGAARNLYYLYVNHMDESPLDAVIKVLSICCGDTEGVTNESTYT